MSREESELDADERVSLVRRLIEAWNANDWDALESVWHPEGKIVAPDGWPESGEFTGWAAIRDQFARLKDPWTTERGELNSIELAGERVLANFRWVGEGEASGARLDADIWMLCEFRDQLISGVRYFTDEAEARVAVREDG
jgi:ketosteroid isomerase-like protein